MQKYKINYHIFENCNMNCEYCFRDKSKNNKINVDWKRIINWIISQGNIDEINIAGGEPTLAPFLLDMVKYCYQHNLKISLITNGLFLYQNKNLLDNLIQYIDCIGISIDSLDNTTNKKIGRCVGGMSMNLTYIEDIYKCVKKYNKVFKINTVVSKLNINDISIYEMNNIKIDRYKLLKNNSDKFLISDDEFILYCDEFKNNMKNIDQIIIEHKMHDTYIKITSDGTIDADSKNLYNIFNDSDAFSKALSNLDKEEYKKRYMN